MISTKRQIKRDDDRYGGFGTDFSSVAMTDDFVRSDDISAPPDYTAGRSMLVSDTDIDIRNESAKQIYEQPVYTGIDRSVAPSTTPDKTDIPARPKKKATAHTSEDVLPTLKTRIHASNNAEAEEAKERVAAAKREHRGLSSREKVMLCVYVVIALILAVAVIATGVSISRASVQADNFAEQIAQKQVIIAEQETELAILRDEDNIRGRALENGMVESGEPVYNAPTAETTEYPEADPRTNGFDKFLDWLQTIIG